MDNYIATISIGKSNKSLSLEDYQGKISVVSTWEGRDGSIKPNWCFRQERENGENVPGKAIPLKLQIGDNKTQAVAILTQLLAALGGAQTYTTIISPSGKPVDDSNIPF